MSELKVGAVVKIYHDPITRKDLEGEAKLLKPLDAMLSEGTQYWLVNFVGDPSTETYIRKVKGD